MVPVIAKAEAARQAASVIPFLIKTAVVCAVGYVVISKYTNRFVSWKEKSSLPAANITKAEAQARASAIAGSISLFGNSFATVSTALAGLNYNGLVRVYNAFGHQRGTFLSGDLDLVAWLRNQFSDYELQQISLITNGVLF